jgi:uncharacterized protein YuzE
MIFKYYEETDTLFVQLSDEAATETRELNENLYVDLDSGGRVVSLTIEHARARSGKLDFAYELVTA